METVEVLKAAREKVRQGWCQGDGAFDADGKSVSVASERAVRWCALGAIGASTVGPNKVWGAAGDFFRDALGQQSIMNWNDEPGRTQQEVLDAFDRAIELAEAA